MFLKALPVKTCRQRHFHEPFCIIALHIDDKGASLLPDRGPEVCHGRQAPACARLCVCLLRHRYN